MRRGSWLLSTMLLTACGELVTDTGFACLVPEQVECMCPYDESCEGYDPALVAEWGGECAGRYSAEATHEVEVMLSRNPGPATDVQCSLEIHADHVLSVNASYRQHPDRDSFAEGELIVACEVPPLEAGTWTLEYGGGTVTFEVGDPEVQPMACAESTHR